MNRCCLLLSAVIFSWTLPSIQELAAQQDSAQLTDKAAVDKSGSKDAAVDESREQRLANYLSGAKFVGNFMWQP